EALRQRRRDQRTDTHPPRGLTEDRHARRIATESADVAAYPLQRRNLIEETVVPAGVLRRFGRQRRMREETKGSEAVVQRYDDGAFLRETCTIVPFLATESSEEATAMNPDEHGFRRARRA